MIEAIVEILGDAADFFLDGALNRWLEKWENRKKKKDAGNPGEA